MPIYREMYSDKTCQTCNGEGKLPVTNKQYICQFHSNCEYKEYCGHGKPHRKGDYCSQFMCARYEMEFNCSCKEIE